MKQLHILAGSTALATLAWASVAHGQPAPQPTVLGTIQVQDSALRDAGATEGSGSYAGGPLTLGKTPTSFRELPQSASVLTRERIEDQNFTGIGVSCGGGMCNVTLAYLSIPTAMFSIVKGGDSIDSAVGAVVNEHATRVRALKEEGLDLTRAPKDKLDKALHIYYDDLVESLVEALRRSLSRADKLPRTERPLSIVLAGGSAKPRGFKELFERTLKSRTLPVAVGEVRMASDPLTATARGALIAAMYEK